METLSQYLERSQLTQAEFAKRVGTTQANISKLCGSDPKISTDLAVKIATATGGSVPITVWPKFRVFAHLNTPHLAPTKEAG